VTNAFPPPLPMPPLTAEVRRSIRKARRTIESKGLTVETIDEIRWKVTAPHGTSLFYFPLEQRWRKGTEWGAGPKGAVMALLPGAISDSELGEVVRISSHPGWLAKVKADYKPFVPSPDDDLS
jgi:hypothetical protein